MRGVIAFAIVLIASLALKLHAVSGDPDDDAVAVTAIAAQRLAARGYRTTIGPSGLQITAEQANCRLAARMLDPHATQLTFLRAALGGTGVLHYAWRGVWHSQAPRMAPLVQFYLARELARQRLAAGRDPVWVIAVPTGCPRPPLSFAARRLTLTMGLPANRLRH